MSNVEKLLTAIINDEDLANYQCQSRIEEYLKNIALGESCENMTPQSRVEYLLKVISEKGLGGGTTGGETSSEEWQPNADMLWAKEVFLADDSTGDYRNLQMIGDLEPTSDLTIYKGGWAKTSDGSYYTNDTDNSITITHTWDDTNARDSQSYKGLYKKVRWIIFNNGTDSYARFLHNTVYAIFDNRSYTAWYQNSHCYLEYFELLNQTGEQINENFVRNCGALKKIPDYLDFSQNNYATLEKCISLSVVPANIYNLPVFKLAETPIEKFDVEMPNLKSLNYSFDRCYLLKVVKNLNTANVESMIGTFSECRALVYLQDLVTDNVKDMNNTFNGCASLRKIILTNTSKVTSFHKSFGGCRALETLSEIDMSSANTAKYMFTLCDKLKNITLKNTYNITDAEQIFDGCYELETLSELDLRNCTNINRGFNSCRSLKNLTLKNIKISLFIGSSTFYGHKLTLDSLLNTLKEYHTNAGNETTVKLTMGSANTAKLADVYVKLIDITDEMRAEDEFIDLKHPFEVCESTDEGAMHIINDYAILLKNIEIA